MKLGGAAPQQRQDQRQTQRLSAVMAQAVTLMSLAPEDLARHLVREAAANPALRLLPPRRAAPGAALAAAPEEGVALVADRPSLYAHVLAQLPRLVPDAAGRAVALVLVEGLDAAGYLVEPLAALARRAGVTVAQAEVVLAQLQEAEPAGLFARSLAECLALQLHADQVLTPAFRALLGRLDLVAARDHAALRQLTGLDEAALGAHLCRLRGLDPRPGRAFEAADPAPAPADLVAVPGEGPGGWRVQLQEDHLPGLELVENAGDRDAEVRARRLIAAFALRQRNLLGLAERIAARQGVALDGPPEALEPMTRRALAADLGLHESTVSRIVAQSRLRLGGRVVPLSALFARPVAGASAARITQALARRLALGPASDAELARWLAEQGMVLSRRQLARYRARLQRPILPRPAAS